MNQKWKSVHSAWTWALLFMMLPGFVLAATHVVMEGGSIGDVLALASAGDSVLVGPGTYDEHGLIMPAGVTGGRNHDMRLLAGGPKGLYPIPNTAVPSILSLFLPVARD